MDFSHLNVCEIFILKFSFSYDTFQRKDTIEASK